MLRETNVLCVSSHLHLPTFRRSKLHLREKGGREEGVSQATQQQRISIRFHHGLDVKHISAEVFGSSPRWRQKDNVAAETGCQLEEIPLDKVNPVSNVVNSSVVLRQVQPICIYVNRQYCKKKKKKRGWGGIETVQNLNSNNI